MPRMAAGVIGWTLALAVLLGIGNRLRAEEPADKAAPEKIEFTEETFDNGLKVIYAPLHNSPVVHVRVLYHVGSRDERPDRQGFAHMFEHMMFRGSAHVAPEQHMKLIGVVGGDSNAFTSFDQTVYVNTIPANHLEMALYLEADRMASFKVDENIYKTERKVVAEEWRLRQNRPYGTLYDDFLRNSFTKHSYQWTPIGNMQHLAAAGVGELQAFFNKYYVPNNAVLVIAGDIEVPKAQELAKKYFGWIPKGPEIEREIPQEPEQAEAHDATVTYPVPLPAILIGYHLPDYKSDDHFALSLLSTILGDGSSSRLDRKLVHGESPLAVDAGALHMQLEDAGIFGVSATVLNGKDPAQVEKELAAAVAEVVEKGVTQEELDKAKTQSRVGLIYGKMTCTNIASQLGDALMFGGDANRVNTDIAKIDAVTLDDIQRVAKAYLKPERATTLRVNAGGGAAAQQAAQEAAKEAQHAEAAEPPPSKVEPRKVEFPDGYPEKPMIADANVKAEFQKGTESEINGVKVIVMTDSRLPLVNWSLTTRRGSHSDPKGKEGLADLADGMVRRGAGGLSFEQLSEDLESRGISLGVADGGDYTRINGSSLKGDLEHGIQRTRDILFSPTFPADEFEKLKNQTRSALLRSRETPQVVSRMELSAALFGDTPLGRDTTPESVSNITLDDVKTFWGDMVRPEGAIFLIAGDVTVEQGQALAAKLLEGWESKSLPEVSYELPSIPAKRRIILVDNPAGKQATIRMGVRAFNNQSDEKYAGSVAGQILTAGIDSRLGRYVRAEKGLAYGVTGLFQPARHGGSFIAATDTALPTTGDAVEAIWKVLNDLRNENVTSEELADAQRRVAGGMVMGMQTIQAQAGYRVDAILNGYPIDYYENYPARVAAVQADAVREVMNKYVNDGEMAVIVVAPASVVKSQLEKLGDVEVAPMPAKREQPADHAQPAAAKKAA